MRQRILGTTGISVSEIGIGSLQLSGPLLLEGRPRGYPDPGKGYVIDLIRRAGELGVTVIDTAEYFGAGEGERRVGEAIKRQRDRWVLCGKFGLQVGELELNSRGVPSGLAVHEVTAARFKTSLEASLRRLQTDYIDIYLCQGLPAPEEAEALASAFGRAKQQGQIRAVGLSSDDFREAQWMRAAGCLDIAEFSRNLLHSQDAMMDLVRQSECGSMVRGSMADGRLSGKYFHDAPAFFPDDERSARYDPASVNEKFLACNVLEPLLGSERTMAQLAIRYLLDDPSTHTIILGARTLDDYIAAIKATELSPLLDSERTQLHELCAPLLAAEHVNADLVEIF